MGSGPQPGNYVCASLDAAAILPASTCDFRRHYLTPDEQHSVDSSSKKESALAGTIGRAAADANAQSVDVSLCQTGCTLSKQNRRRVPQRVPSTTSSEAMSLRLCECDDLY